MSKKPKGIPYQLFGYAIVHLLLCSMYFIWPERYEGTRSFPLVLPMIVFGPLLNALYIYWHFLRGSKGNE